MRALQLEGPPPCAEVDPEIFFPVPGQSPEPARQICRSCDVQQECLDEALRLGYQVYGIWGGLTENQRREVRKAS